MREATKHIPDADPCCSVGPVPLARRPPPEAWAVGGREAQNQAQAEFALAEREAKRKSFEDLGFFSFSPLASGLSWCSMRARPGMGGQGRGGRPRRQRESAPAGGGGDARPRPTVRSRVKQLSGGYKGRRAGGRPRLGRKTHWVCHAPPARELGGIYGVDTLGLATLVPYRIHANTHQ